MSDSQKMVECVVVFDEIGLATGEYIEQGPGMHPLAVTTSAFRSDKVMLSEYDAERHIASGAVILASDKRAKLIKPNTAHAGGVSRDAALSAGGNVELEQIEPTTAGTPGVIRGKNGKLGSKAELEKLSVSELKKLAADHGVLVERGDTKPTLAAKLAKVKIEPADADEPAEEAPEAEAEPGAGDEPAPESAPAE